MLSFLPKNCLHAFRSRAALAMPQNEYIEDAIKKNGKRQNYEVKKRKKEARAKKLVCKKARTLIGIKAKMFSEKRRKEKIQLRKRELHQTKRKEAEVVSGDGVLPSYLLDRREKSTAAVLSNTLKEKRKEKGGKWDVPVSKIKGCAETEIFKTIKSGKRKRNAWKRMVTKMTFVGEDYTRNNPKYERFIRPTGLRVRKASVTHPGLKTTFQLPILSVKENPQSEAQTKLGILTKGSLIEVNVSELGLVTTGGKIVWGKYAQITNNPENDGCVNAVLLV
ncbi:MAG: ribosome biogenesis protein NSA2 [Amphiamblys sp. WSBS2006]|nr:MAG: ribosome biogenesis protein NSA2 [Amphiamblys sp. WSBS2006]